MTRPRRVLLAPHIPSATVHPSHDQGDRAMPPTKPLTSYSRPTAEGHARLVLLRARGARGLRRPTPLLRDLRRRAPSRGVCGLRPLAPRDDAAGSSWCDRPTAPVSITWRSRSAPSAICSTTTSGSRAAASGRSSRQPRPDHVDVLHRSRWQPVELQIDNFGRPRRVTPGCCRQRSRRTDRCQVRPRRAGRQFRSGVPVAELVVRD